MGRFTDFFDDILGTSSHDEQLGSGHAADSGQTDHGSDWSSAWGTAAAWQVPAESNYDEPTHSYVEDTYWRDDHSFD
jgi:hypothetical protein